MIAKYQSRAEIVGLELLLRSTAVMARTKTPENTNLLFRAVGVQFFGLVFFFFVLPLPLFPLSDKPDIRPSIHRLLEQSSRWFLAETIRWHAGRLAPIAPVAAHASQE